MNEKRSFDAVLSHLTNRLNSRGEGSERNELEQVIRVLEAAGKVDKKKALELINDVPRDERLYGEGFTGSGEYSERKQIRALLESLPDGGGEIIKTKIPVEVIFPGNPEILPEKVIEYVYMPSGDIVVRVEGGESLWFNKHGIHPKSRLIFKVDRYDGKEE